MEYISSSVFKVLYADYRPDSTCKLFLVAMIYADQYNCRQGIFNRITGYKEGAKIVGVSRSGEKNFRIN